MDNAAIARALADLADCMAVSGEAAFKVRAFRGAARAIDELAEPAVELLSRGTLTDVRGVGAGVARRVAELVETGDLAELAERRGRLPPGLRDLVSLPGVGLKTAEALWTKLGVADIDDLETAARAGRIRALPRFSEAREKKLLEAVTTYRERGGSDRRLTVDRASRFAERVLERLAGRPDVRRVASAGSLRRGAETVGDLDVLVSARPEDAAAILRAMETSPDVAEILAGGDAKTTVRLREGPQVDVRVVPEESWGAALQYFTGSKEHNVALRALAVRRGLKVNEYGVFDEHGARVAGATEEDVYAALDLAWIPPELREDRGELERFATTERPALIERSDVLGDLHMHTTETDGRATLEEMAEAAISAGLRYIAITDHSQALTMARGVDVARLRAQGARIDALNARLGDKLRILRGIEADILPDGTVDLGPDVLGSLDWVIASVHGQFALSREDQTRRVVRALESGVVDCLGHPTGRMLGRRPGYSIDLPAVLDAARRANAAVELNASPNRLDLDEHGLRLAKEMGVRVVISSDAHNPRQLGFVDYGVRVARRAWLSPSDVLNTLSVDALLARPRPRPRAARAQA